MIQVLADVLGNKCKNVPGSQKALGINSEVWCVEPSYIRRLGNFEDCHLKKPNISQFWVRTQEQGVINNQRSFYIHHVMHL